MKSYILISLVLFVAVPLFGQETLMINAYNRPSTSLNGYWKYIVDS